MDGQLIERVKYMTGELIKTSTYLSTPLDGGDGYGGATN